MTPKQVVFGELPAAQRNERGEAPWKTQLREQPGAWAWVRAKSTSVLNKQSRSAGFEACQRTVNGQRRIYCRFIDPEEANDAA